VSSAEEIMVSVVWVEKGVILVILLPVGTTVALNFLLKPPRKVEEECQQRWRIH